MKTFTYKKPIINPAILKTWLSLKDENIYVLMRVAGLSMSMIEKMRCGKYQKEVKPFTRNLICSVIGKNEKELFPLTEIRVKRDGK